MIEGTLSRSDVLDPTILKKLVEEQLSATLPSVKLPVVTMGLSQGWPLGDAQVGDDCRLIIPPDEFWPTGYDSAAPGGIYWRTGGWTVTLADDGLSTVAVALTVPPTIEGE